MTDRRTDTRTANVIPLYPATIMWQGIKRFKPGPDELQGKKPLFSPCAVAGQVLLF